MDVVIQDLRYALRQLARSPGFSFFVVATLAIGIGANTTIFSVLNSVLLRPLPWEGGERMVQLSGAFEGRGDDWSVSLPNAQDWRTRSRSFDDVAYYQGASMSVADDGAPERVAGIRSSPNLFDFLGVRPLLGRTYTPEEAHPDADRVVVLSHALWQSRYAADRNVIGRTISLSGRPHTVIGVMPRGFAFPDEQSLMYLPVRATATTWTRASGGLSVVARLRSGVTIEEAGEDLSVLSARLAEEYPESNADLSAAIRPWREALYGGGDTNLMLYLLLGGVGFVLLIACANVANLLLARGTAREREVAVRAAIGAGRGRVVRQLLTENILLALLGGIAGCLIALWGTRALAGLIPLTSSLPRTFAIDGTVLAFTAGLALLTGLLFGVVPSIHAARIELTSLMGGRTGTGGRRRGRRRSALVIAEVALASVLLVCAGLMVRSLSGLLRTDPGFRAENLLTMRVALDASYDSPEKVLSFQQRALDELHALPGARAAGAVDFMPLGGTSNFNDIYTEGQDEPQNAGTLIATPGYIEAMGIPLLRGRMFTAQDVRSAPGVAVVSRTLAERLWPGQDAIGKRIVLNWERGEQPYWRTVIGIVGDVRHGGLTNDPRAEFYISFGQLTWANPGMTFGVRTDMEPTRLAAAVRDAIWRVDAKQAVYDVRTAERVVRETDTVFAARLMAGALGVFGLLALLLAALGLYGVISYSVAQRTYEIGVRSALGARQTDVLGLVLRQGMGLVVLGLLIGLAGSFAATRLLRTLLYGVSPTDPLAFAAMSLILLLVAAAATLVPARRAARIDPMVALRSA